MIVFGLLIIYFYLLQDFWKQTLMKWSWFAKKSLNGEQTVKIKKAKCSALTFSPCIVYLLITCLVQVQKEVSHFRRGPGLAVHVGTWAGGPCRGPLWGSQCDPLVFSLPVLHVAHRGHLFRSCFNKTMLFLQQRLQKWGRLMDWLGEPWSHQQYGAL